MRKVMFTCVLAFLALGIGACTPEQIAQQVRDYTATTCKYLPTTTTVLKILTKATVVDTVAGVGNEICLAISTLPLAEGPGKRQAVVRGVVVKGSFVR